MALAKLSALPLVNLYLDPLRSGSIQTSIDVTQLTPECEAWARQSYDFEKYNMLASQASALAAQNPNSRYRFYRDSMRAGEAGLYDRYYISRDDREAYLREAANFLFQAAEMLRRLGAALNLPSFWLTFEAQTATFPRGPTAGLPWPRIGPSRTITDLVHGAGLPTSWATGADRVMQNTWVQGFSCLPLYDPAVQSDPYWGAGGAWGNWGYAAGMTAPGLIAVWRDMRTDASGRDFPYLAVRTLSSFIESWRPAMGPRLSCEYAANLLRFAAGQSGPGLLKTVWRKWASFVRLAATAAPLPPDTTLETVNAAAAVVDAAGDIAFTAGMSSGNPYLIVGGAALKATSALMHLSSSAVVPSCLELPQRAHHRPDLLGLLCPPVEPFLSLPPVGCGLATTSTPGGDRGSGWTAPSGWRDVPPPPPPPSKKKSSMGWYVGGGLLFVAAVAIVVTR